MCFGGDFTNQIYFIWEISDSKQLSNLSIKMVLVWELILSSGISSSSEVSTYLLSCSALALAIPWSSYVTQLALALVSVLVWGLILLAGGSSLDEPGVLFLCLNMSASVSVKPVRPDFNVSAILSGFPCCLFQNFLKV